MNYANGERRTTQRSRKVGVRPPTVPWMRTPLRIGNVRLGRQQGSIAACLSRVLHEQREYRLEAYATLGTIGARFRGGKAYRS
jgi:hypothetical protein